MRHGSDLIATCHATSAPMGPKNKECTSQDGTVDESEPFGAVFQSVFLKHVKYFILSCNVC